MPATNSNIIGAKKKLARIKVRTKAKMKIFFKSFIGITIKRSIIQLIVLSQLNQKLAVISTTFTPMNANPEIL